MIRWRLRPSVLVRLIGSLMLLSVAAAAGGRHRLVPGLALDPARGSAPRCRPASEAQRDYLELQIDQVESLIGNLMSVEAITAVFAPAGNSADIYDELATQARIGYLLNGYMDVHGLVSIDIFIINGRHYHVGDTLDVRSIDEHERDALFAAAERDPDTILWAGIEPNVNRQSRHRQVIATARSVGTYGPRRRRSTAGLLLVSQDVDYHYQGFRAIEGDMPGRHDAGRCARAGSSTTATHPHRPHRTARRPGSPVRASAAPRSAAWWTGVKP